MTKIIGLVQVKGGAGRSTVSTNLAGELSKAGKTVLIDCDMPQGTSASWFAVRQQKGRQGNLKADTATDHSDLINKVKQHCFICTFRNLLPLCRNRQSNKHYQSKKVFDWHYFLHMCLIQPSTSLVSFCSNSLPQCLHRKVILCQERTMCTCSFRLIQPLSFPIET